MPREIMGGRARPARWRRGGRYLKLAATKGPRRSGPALSAALSQLPPTPTFRRHEAMSEKCQCTKSLRDSGGMWLVRSVFPTAAIVGNRRCLEDRGIHPQRNAARRPIGQMMIRSVTRRFGSRMNREVQVRFCERLGVQFPGPTRQNEKPPFSGLCSSHQRRHEQVQQRAGPNCSYSIISLMRASSVAALGGCAVYGGPPSKSLCAFSCRSFGRTAS